MNGFRLPRHDRTATHRLKVCSAVVFFWVLLTRSRTLTSITTRSPKKNGCAFNDGCPRLRDTSFAGHSQTATITERWTQFCPCGSAASSQITTIAYRWTQLRPYGSAASSQITTIATRWTLPGQMRPRLTHIYQSLPKPVVGSKRRCPALRAKSNDCRPLKKRVLTSIHFVDHLLHARRTPSKPP
jgi:hypothetical protein